MEWLDNLPLTYQDVVKRMRRVQEEYKEYMKCRENGATVRVIGPGLVRSGGKKDGMTFGKEKRNSTKSYETPMNQFQNHLDQASATVATWPAWKQNVLGTRRPPMKIGKSLENMTKDQRKTYPIARGLIDYFPDALAAIAHVSFVGNEQHNPGQPLYWARGKSTDQADCLMRHFLARGTLDNDGLRHTAKVAWRALAILQLEIENERIDAEPIEIPTKGRNDQFIQKGYGTPTYYLVGPMRGYDLYNFPAFDLAEDVGKSLGFNIINPANLDRAAGVNLPGTELTEDQLQDCIDRDVAAILKLNPKTDGVAVLPGWRESKGASAEVALAVWRGLEVLNAEGFKTVIYERRA